MLFQHWTTFGYSLGLMISFVMAGAVTRSPIPFTFLWAALFLFMGLF